MRWMDSWMVVGWLLGDCWVESMWYGIYVCTMDVRREMFQAGGMGYGIDEVGQIGIGQIGQIGQMWQVYEYDIVHLYNERERDSRLD